LYDNNLINKQSLPTISINSRLESYEGATQLLRANDIYGREQARFLSRSLADICTEFYMPYKYRTDDKFTLDATRFLSRALTPVSEYFKHNQLSRGKGLNPLKRLAFLLNKQPTLPSQLTLEEKVLLLNQRLQWDGFLGNTLTDDTLRGLLYSLNGGHPFNAALNKTSSSLTEVIQGVGLTLSEQLKANHT
jgi:hypothetical protein